MENGIFNTCYAPVGFDLINGKLTINEQEAPVIQQIFIEYLNGQNSREIAADLNKKLALGRFWRREAVDYILQNERYAGNALLQKHYATESFPRQKKVNHGERPMYYVNGSNDAIISQEIFNRAEDLRKKRKTAVDNSLHSEVSRQLRCSCGSRIRAKKINEKWYWCCCNHDEKRECPIKAIPEAEVQNAFCRLYYKLKHQSIPILEQMISGFQMIRSRKILWNEEIIALNKKIADLYSQNQLLAFLKQQGLVDSDIFIAKSSDIAKQLQQAKREKGKLINTADDNTLPLTQDLIDLLENGPGFLDEFSMEYFQEIVDKVIFESNESVRFYLKNGLALRETVERTVR